MRTLDQVISGDQWIDLNDRYSAVFGESIPTMELPADGDAALALIQRAIDTKNDGVFSEGIEEGALI